jgi:L-iditol 2-dehydrogenase
MVAAVLHGPAEVRFEEVPVPAPGPGEVLARVDVASTDFTDRKVFLTANHPMIRVPGLFGHEWAGTIVRLGQGVPARWQVGMRVVAANSAPCVEPDAAARCRACRRGRVSLCERIMYNNGAFAPFIRVPAPIVTATLHPIPSLTPSEPMVLTEPLACVEQAVRRLPAQAGDVVAVLGAGPIGLLFVARLRARHGSALRILALDHHEARLAVAREFGADEVVNTAGRDALAAVRERIAPLAGVDIAIEAVGAVEATREAFALLGRGGTLVPFGGIRRSIEVPLDLGRLHYEELAILPIYHHTPADVASAVRALVDGQVPAERLITARLPLRELRRALDMVADRTALKTLVYPE